MDVVIPFATFLFLGSVAVAFASRFLPDSDREWMRTLMLVALLLRMAAATAFAMFPSLRLFHEDAEGYEYIGINIASVWRGEYPPFPFNVPNPGFYYLAAVLNLVFGRYLPVLSYFNCVVGTMLVFFTYRLAIQFFHPAVGRLCALMIGLLPSMILWSSVALKDALITLMLVIALSSCVSLKRRVSFQAVVGVLIPLLVIQSVRFYMVYFLGFAIVVSLVLDRGVRFFTGIYKQIFVVVAALTLFALLGFTEARQGDMNYFSLEYASNYRRGMAISAKSGFDADVDVSTPTSALAYLPVGMAHLLWAPFPWQMVSLRPLLAAPETVLWWFLFPATVRGIVFAIRRRFADTSALLIFSLTLTCAYSLIHGNVGSAFRQRAQILVFLFVFCAAGIYIRRLRKAGQNADAVLSPGADETSTTVDLPEHLRPSGIADRV